MNKLYFRAWLKDKKEMVEVVNLFISNHREHEVGYYDENDLLEMCMLSECELMQGIEINGKVVYEGDIIEYDLLSDGDRQRAGIEILRDLFNIERLILINGIEFEVIGNIYENKELVE